MFELPEQTDINGCVIDAAAIEGGKPRLIKGTRRRTMKRSEQNRMIPDSEVS